MDFEKLQAIIADVLNKDLEEITPESSFVDDLGADSLDIGQILMAVEDEMGIEMSTEGIEKLKTIQDVLDKLKTLG